ncbi:sulfatase [Verrucomicrobiaceae bacterium N1E253]|uniref:Sulfatase n=1 Tax=Oceaniferula marina TaxID=2748318 RepID=A0A851GKM2_9BACT|nr:sulfatase [Oceaniferula marina]NWK57592.1 sulfatase [Oceaniferula marina]
MPVILFLLLCLPLLGAESKPNIVYIMADDLTHRDLGCYGGQAHTPHIDALAKQGKRFTQCFQAAPMCSPTRHNIYTGLYPVKSGAYPNHTFAKSGTKSIVHYLKPLGYRVALSGKTHIAPKEVFPFEYSGKKNPDMKAIDELMRDSKSSGKPFCLFACSNEPHTPWDKGDASRYPVDQIKLPPYYVDTPETRKGFAKYLAEITYYDSQVGQILALLDQHGLTENTLVMVTSEQGNSLPFAKWTCYDSGLQSGLVCRWPGVVEAGTSSDALVEFVDFTPTFIDAAGGSRPATLDGQSLLPLLKGESNEHKDYVYGIMTTRGIHSGSDYYGIRSVRSKSHKLIVNLSPEAEFSNTCMKTKEFKSWEARAAAGDAHAATTVARYKKRPALELYDLTKDPFEMNNIASNPENAPLIAALRTQLETWMNSQGDLGQATELAANERQTRGKKKRKTNKKK